MNLSEAPRLVFKIDWLDRIDAVDTKTLASISLLFEGMPIWPVKGEDTGEFDWYVDELLAHLTECWKPLILRQTYPISVRPERPSSFLAEAAKRWSGLPGGPLEAEESEVAAFEDVHNLANAFGGVSGLLPFWFLRDQDQMIIDTQEFLLQVSFSEAVEALETVGNLIAARLRQANEQKWGRLLQAWSRREQGDPTNILALAIGRDRETTAALIAENVLEPPQSFDEAANDDNVLRIAARMAGPLPFSQTKTVLEKVRSCEARNSPKLEEISKEAWRFIYENNLETARPHVQGNELAVWLRRKLDLSPNRMVDPIHVLERMLNIDVRALDFKIPTLEAIAVWGPHHGPAVLLNRTSNRVGNPSRIMNSGGTGFCGSPRRMNFVMSLLTLITHCQRSMSWAVGCRCGLSNAPRRLQQSSYCQVRKRAQSGERRDIPSIWRRFEES
jgi:hypothetical protein